MNVLSKKMLGFFIVVFFFYNLNAQDKENPWLISFGVNAVDYYPTNISGMKSESGSGTQWYDQFFKVSGHYNFIKAPSKLSVGRYLNESFNIELAGSVNKIIKFGNARLAESVSYFAIDLNLNYDINKIIGETSWFDPYIIGGIGFNAMGNHDSNAVQFINYGSINGGVGAKLWLSKDFGVKGQTVYKHFFNDDAFQHFQHSISIIYKLGGYDEDNDGIYDKVDECPSIFGLAEFNGCPDSDDDGVKDSEDKCPNVFGAVELNGCPDTDGDGVTDALDRCPEIKGDKKFNGCPDTDGDGVIDILDRCVKVAGSKSNKGCPEPDTDGDGVIDKNDKCKFEKGVLSNNGCPDIKEKLETVLTDLASSVLFVSGSDVFYKKYEIELDKIAELMIKHNKLKFQIQGYTDDVGTEQSNLKLSLKRVNKVLVYLVSKGVNKFNLNIIGLGEAMPIATNNTAVGRAKNRRVEVKILN